MGAARAFGVNETHGILWRETNRLRASSDGAGWTSLYASAQREAPYQASYGAVPDHLVILHLDGPVGVSRYLGKGQARRAIPPGGLFILPGGVDFGVRLEGKLESLHVYIRDSVLREVASDLFGARADAMKLAPRLGDQDPLIERLALNIRDALGDPDPSASVYVDYLSRALGAHLLRAHSSYNGRASEPRAPGALTRAQLDRVVDCMDANLTDTLTLADLASAAGLSPTHFARRFKATTGAAPHQHVMRLRLQRAQRLLRETPRSIAQVAFECGFAHQGHLTRVFTRLAGITPAAFRRAAHS
ncbi:MAG TPA: AraC family transcriptional regulator [Roseiarcus sp.]|jgi:AraC family transcriptional regulator